MTGGQRVDLTQPRLILCEGKSDQYFFKQLLKVRAIDAMQVVTRGGGNTDFAALLKYLELSEGFDAVRLIIVAADYDDTKAFNKVCKALGAAGYNRPTDPRVIVRTMHKPAIAILMVPEAPPGCLETLCVQAAYGKWPNLQAPLEGYLAQTEVTNWEPTEQDKSRVECLLASTAKPRPAVALFDHWQMDNEYHIPVDGAAFASVAEFLTSDAIAEFA